MNEALMPQRNSYTGLTVVHGKVACTIPPDDETVNVAFRRRLGRQCGININRLEIKELCLKEIKEEDAINNNSKKSKKKKSNERLQLLQNRKREDDKLAPPSFIVGREGGVSVWESMSWEQLTVECNNRGIPLPDSVRKKDLVDSLVNHDGKSTAAAQCTTSKKTVAVAPSIRYKQFANRNVTSNDTNISNNINTASPKQTSDNNMEHGL